MCGLEEQGMQGLNTASRGACFCSSTNTSDSANQGLDGYFIHWIKRVCAGLEQKHLHPLSRTWAGDYCVKCYDIYDTSLCGCSIPPVSSLAHPQSTYWLSVVWSAVLKVALLANINRPQEPQELQGWTLISAVKGWHNWNLERALESWTVYCVRESPDLEGHLPPPSSSSHLAHLFFFPLSFL